MKDKMGEISDDGSILKFVDKLSTISFRNLEFADVGNLLSVPFFELKNIDLSIRSSKKELIKSIILYNYKYSTTNTKEILFFYSPDYLYNKGYTNMFNSVQNLIDNKGILQGYKKPIIRLGLLKCYFLYRHWLRQMKSISMSNKIKKYAAINMLKAYSELKKVKKAILTKPKAIVTLCDVHLIDNIVTQYANRNKITTVTLQHGHFNAKDRGWVFSKSLSNYFLAHGEYAIREAKKSGANIEKFVPVGMMNFINKEIKNSCIKNSHRFALVLNGPGAKEDNYDFIKIANLIARKYNLKYITRSHPALNINMYKDLLDKNLWIGECDSNESIPEFTKKVDFTLVGNSTVFMELIYMDRIVFRYKGISQDIYEGIDWCAFSNEQSLFELINKFISDNGKSLQNQLLETKDYLCQKGNVSDNYKQFLNFIQGE